MKRALLIALIVLVVLLVTPLLVLAWVVGTESGTRFAFERSAGYLPEGVQIGGIAGRLGDRVVLHDIEYEADGLHAQVGRVELEWTPRSLTARRLVVRELLASGVRIATSPADVDPDPPPGQPIELPERIDLPLAIVVERAAVSDLQLVVADAEPMVLDHLELAATFESSRLDLQHLELRSPLLDLDAAAALTAADDYPLMLAADWVLRPEGFPEAAGTTRVDGTIDELAIEQRLAPPYDIALTAVVTDLLAGPEGLHVAAALESGRLEPVTVQPDLPDGVLSLTLRVNGLVDALEVEGELLAEEPELGAFRAAFVGRLQPDRVTIASLVVDLPDRPGRVEAQGRVDLAPELIADVHLRWDDLQWPLEGSPAVRTRRGELELRGPLDAYELQFRGDLEVPDQPQVALELSGAGSLESIALTLQASTEIGRLGGRADVVWSPEIEARVDLEGDGVDPALFAPDWPGQLGFALVAEGSLADEVLSVTVERFAADGHVREEPLTLDARGVVRQDFTAEGLPFVEIDALAFALGSTRVDATGRLDEIAHLEWSLEAPDLAAFVPAARGALSGNGTLTGSLPWPRIELALEGSGLGFEDYRLDALLLQAALDPSGAEASSLELEASEGRADELLLERFALTASGTPGTHTLGLRVRSSQGDVDLDLEGALQQPLTELDWRFRLVDGRLAYPQLGPWQLMLPAEGRAAADGVRIGQHCWSSGDAHLCLGAEQSPAGLQADVDLRGLPWSYFQPFLPPDLDLGGEVAVTASLRQPNGEPLTGEVELVTQGGMLEAVVAGGDDAPPTVARLRLQPSHARLALQAEEATADVSLVTERGFARLVARVPNGAAGDDGDTPWPERALEGELALDVPDLAFVSELVADVTEVAGTLAGRMRLAGTVGDPALSGQVTLERGGARIPAAGITVSDLRLEVAGDGADGVVLSASAQSGGGTLALDGELALLSDNPGGRLRLRGQDFQAANTREARLFISPDLEIVADAERVDITGDLRIPRADITPGNGPAAAVTPSSDQRLLSVEDDENLEHVAERELHARVRVILGDAVRFDGFGLTARFVGNLLAVQTPGAPTTGTGEINILDGEYRAYGQGLVIETGNVYFAGGPLTEPALDIRAVRRPQAGILVGAHVVGTLEEPQFTLFSEPAMSQQEQLSYLVLGRSLREAPSGEGSALSQAALAMGLRGGDFLARNLGERVGFDQFGIETGTGEAGAASDPSQAALVAGRYLTPRLYVSYGIGLFNPVNVLRIQYTIADRWQLITQSSSESTGADLVYRLERGR